MSKWPLSKWPIRVKLLVGLSLLVLLVGILSGSGLYTMYAYRTLAKNLSWRVGELPVAAKLSRHVGKLQNTLSELHGLRQQQESRDRAFPIARQELLLPDPGYIHVQFHDQLGEVDDTLSTYRTHLDRKLLAESRIADNQLERATVRKIEAVLARIRRASENDDWIDEPETAEALEANVADLRALAAELPEHLHRKLAGFRNEVRKEYRTLIVGTWITSIIAAVAFALFVKLAWQWMLQPLRTIIQGSHRVAAGEFGYRIHLDGEDEMSQLAEAMNDMTDRFEAIRDDLDAQVRERTKQVVRNEQLASVGFLAAGVAHEINNPLASIAMCAESLQARIHEVLPRQEEAASSDGHAVIDRYLQMIQDEAFRCKEITEKLLDFSRTGPAQRQNTDVGELVQDMVDMVRRIGKYRRKRIGFDRPEPVLADVSAAEIKQVVLNLLTNALDSLDDGGTVRVTLQAPNGSWELTFADDGCGMTAEVLEHVFEPFFTQRPAGRGTGLGLSITHRIVTDHGGEIVAESPGPGQGATFRVRLPRSHAAKEIEDRYHAA